MLDSGMFDTHCGRSGNDRRKGESNRNLDRLRRPVARHRALAATEYTMGGFASLDCLAPSITKNQREKSQGCKDARMRCGCESAASVEEVAWTDVNGSVRVTPPDREPILICPKETSLE